MAKKGKPPQVNDTRKISEMRNLGPACEMDFRQQWHISVEFQDGIGST